MSDVYSLGVILYELLTGRRPYRLTSRIMHEVVRVICEEKAERASTAVLRAEVVPTGDGKTLHIAPGKLSGTREGTPVDLQRRLAGALDDVLAKAWKRTQCCVTAQRFK